MDTFYPPPSIPGVTQGSSGTSFGDNTNEDTPLSRLASDKGKPGMQSMMLAIQHLQQAQVDDPRLLPITGEALRLLLGPQRTHQSPDADHGGPTPGGAI